MSYLYDISPSDAEKRKPRYYVRYAESILVPRFLAFHESSEALHGWFRLFLSSEYEVYHMRRKVEPLDGLMRIDKDEERERIKERRRLFQQEYYERFPDHPYFHVKQVIEEPSNDATSSEASSPRDPPKAVEATQQVEDLPYENPPEEVKEVHEGVVDQVVSHGLGYKTISCRVDPVTRVMYYIYKTSTDKRQRILQYAAFTVGHLGVFAFLFQVFDDRGAIMQICCYFQLFVLLLCFMLYALSYLMDFIIVQVIKKDTKFYERTERKQFDIKEDGVCQYVHCIFAISEYDLSNDQQMERKERLSNILDLSGNSYIYPALDILFAASTIMIECLTIAYIYTNIRGNDQGQDGKSQQTLTAISNVCKILGLG